MPSRSEDGGGVYKAKSHYEQLESHRKELSHLADTHVVKPATQAAYQVKHALYKGLGFVMRGGRSFRKVVEEHPAFRPPRSSDLALIAQLIL